MDETAARDWLVSTFDVPRETFDRLDTFRALLSAENKRQNLVSEASLADFWARHVADSAQLLLHRPAPTASWIDLGTGAGFPGLIIALLHEGAVTLVEERRLRVDFLVKAAETLGIGAKAEIIGSRVERVAPRAFDVISARAFAPLDKLLKAGRSFAATNTCWILPKGRNAEAELAAARTSWQGDFRLEQSLTDPDARIIVAEGVRPRGKGKSRS